ncbi:hypothetical protein O6H91_15G016300 [Diphasiastrum complanatum]|uniref:Uncharacterized protein n=1 Tax=Diphasiastrum complanatum TaxID=34168 RepID=A0ACC2BG16_DIPCM|nr:hypothetical protein O6H91_15G016300 [Diphasiastrum complanatum]
MAQTIALSALLAITSIIIAAFKWSSAPKEVPFWWDVHSHPLWWVPKWVGLFLLPILQFIIPYIIHVFAERDSDLGRQGGESKHAASHIVALPALFLFFVQNFVILESATSVTHDFHPHLFAASVALWLLLWFGYNVRKLEYNSTIGILTPWTLSSAATWDATHYHAGWAFIVDGIILLIFSLAVPKGLVLYIGLLIFWLGSYIYVFAYSYFISGSDGNEALLG